MNNKKIVWGIAGVVVLVAVFYIGLSYGKSQVPVGTNAQFTQGSGTRMRNGSGAGGFTAGKIIAKDANSITVELMTGGVNGTPSGSKIIFLDTNTKVSKQAAGTLSDLAIGAEVSVTGTTNTDGSENAQTIQIRPNMPAGAKVQ